MSGPDIVFQPDFIPEAERRPLFRALAAELAWAAETIVMFGERRTVPRLVAWYGDPGATYRYSGADHDPQPWTPGLDDLRRRIEAACGAAFNSVLGNLYRDGADAMGWHADDEPELGPDPVIASLSLGATRRFRFKPRRGVAGPGLDLALTDGALLVMRGATQREYLHSVPRQAQVTGPRINLTFRQVGWSAGAQINRVRAVAAPSTPPYIPPNS